MARKLTLSSIGVLHSSKNNDSIIERVFIRAKVNKALKDVKNGKIITHDELKREMTDW